MSNLPISALPNDGQAEATDVFVVVDGATGTTRKLTVSQLETYLATVLAGGDEYFKKGGVMPGVGEEDLWLDGEILKVRQLDNTFEPVAGTAATPEIKIGGVEPLVGEENFWLDNGVFKVRQPDDSFLFTGSALSPEDQAKLDALIADAPVILATAPATAGDALGLNEGDLIQDSNGQDYIVVTDDGVLTPYILNKAGVVELTVDPNTLGAITGFPAGQVVADTSTTPDTLYHFDADTGGFTPFASSEIHRGTRVTAPEGTKLVIEDDGSIYGDLDSDGDFTDETAIGGGDGITPASGTVSLTVVGSAPTTSTSGNEGELQTNGSDCYVLSDLVDGTIDLSAGSYDSLSFDLSATGNPYFIRIYNGGGNAIVWNNLDELFKKFSLSTPYDISTSVYDSVSSSNIISSGNTTAGSGGFLSEDGLNIYVVQNNGVSERKIFQHSLTSPFNISSSVALSSFDYSTEISSTGTVNIFLTKDGLNMYLVNSSTVYRYLLSTSYVVSTASFVESLSLSTRGVSVSADGNTMYSFTGNSLKRYTLPTAYSLSGILDDSNILSLSQVAFGNNAVLDTVGNKVYGLGTNEIEQYSIPDSSTYTWDTITCPSTSPFILSNGDFTLDGGNLPDIAIPTDGLTAVNDTNPTSIVVWRWDGVEWVDVTSLSDTSYTVSVGPATGTFTAQSGETITVTNGIITSIA